MQSHRPTNQPCINALPLRPQLLVEPPYGQLSEVLEVNLVILVQVDPLISVEKSSVEVHFIRSRAITEGRCAGTSAQDFQFSMVDFGGKMD